MSSSTSMNSTTEEGSGNEGSMSSTAPFPISGYATANPEEPEQKKLKLSDKNPRGNTIIPDIPELSSSSINNFYMVHKKLEERICGILCCTVCLDLPQTAIYQVKSLNLNLFF